MSDELYHVFRLYTVISSLLNDSNTARMNLVNSLANKGVCGGEGGLFSKPECLTNPNSHWFSIVLNLYRRWRRVDVMGQNGQFGNVPKNFSLSVIKFPAVRHLHSHFSDSVVAETLNERRYCSFERGLIFVIQSSHGIWYQHRVST